MNYEPRTTNFLKKELKMSHPSTTQTQFLTLRSQGLSYDNIAKELRVSKHTLLDWAKEFRPPIDARLQSALQTYHATLTHRAEALAQQFQTIAQNITSCDFKSSAYPRMVNLLLRLHKALQEFDFNPAAEPEDSTKTAPIVDIEPDSTKTAPPTEHQALCTEHSSSPEPAPTLTPDSDYLDQYELEPISSEEGLQAYIASYRRQYQTDPPEGELKKIRRILKRLYPPETKIAS
jgi:hypothetical protein